jgi:hypothetical protein
LSRKIAAIFSLIIHIIGAVNPFIILSLSIAWLVLSVAVLDLAKVGKYCDAWLGYDILTFIRVGSEE